MAHCWSCAAEVGDLITCPKCGADLSSQTRAINLTSLRSTPTPAPVPVERKASADDLTDADGLAISELPANCALLIVKRGPQAGSRFLLDADETKVGRASNNEIFLDDVSVSRKHGVFQRVSGPEGLVRFSVSDVGSLNGTYVNRDRIDSMELSSGDEVQIGKFRLIFFPGVMR